MVASTPRQPEKIERALAAQDLLPAVARARLAASRPQRIPSAVTYCMLTSRPIQALAVVGALICLSASYASAQCRPPRSSNEAKLLAFYSVPIVFSADIPALSLSAGAVRLSGEGAYVPKASSTLQQTGYCYTGKAENTGLTSFFGRPRLAVGLPAGFGLEVSYLPPMTVASATPNLGSAALWFTRAVNSDFSVTARAHGTVGIVKGPITCPRSALQQQDSQAPCYGNDPSTDEFRPDMAGLELVASTNPVSARRVRFAAGIGVNQLYPRFRVGFSDLNGGTDRTRIVVNLTRVTALAGASMTLTPRCDASAQLFSSPSDATTVRASLGCLLRK